MGVCFPLLFPFFFLVFMPLTIDQNFFSYVWKYRIKWYKLYLILVVTKFILFFSVFLWFIALNQSTLPIRLNCLLFEFYLQFSFTHFFSHFFVWIWCCCIYSIINNRYIYIYMCVCCRVLVSKESIDVRSFDWWRTNERTNES